MEKLPQIHEPLNRTSTNGAVCGVEQTLTACCRVAEDGLGHPSHSNAAHPVLVQAEFIGGGKGLWHLNKIIYKDNFLKLTTVKRKKIARPNFDTWNTPII